MTPRTVSREVRLGIFGRDNWTCTYCGYETFNEQLLSVDHFIPWSPWYVDHNLSNLLTCCRRCNTVKGSKAFRIIQEVKSFIALKRI